MPTIPSVFRNIRKNDVHQRPFKAYKNYIVTETDAVAEKNAVQRALHKKVTPHVSDATYNYPLNSTDNTNQHVIWNWIDHRYYRYGYDQARCHELTDIMKTEKFYFWNASILSVPYHQMGERIKPNSVVLQTFITGSSTNKFNANFRITGSDDGLGNLRDLSVNEFYMASSSNDMFYLSFNEQFRKFDDNFGLIKSNQISYKLRKLNKKATISNVKIEPGISTVVSGSGVTGVYAPSGIAGQFTSSLSSYISIPHNENFNELQRCDDWGVSFWMKPNKSTVTDANVLISKFANITETYYDQRNGMQKVHTINKPTPKTPLSLNNTRTPLHIVHKDNNIHYISSDGSKQMHISASLSSIDGWSHVFIRNHENVCKLYVNGVATGTSSSISRQPTANHANILLGTDTLDLPAGNNYNGALAELHLYSYGLTDLEIASLANNDFYTGSLYQTNRIGNVFYKNGQIVISSPMPKYQDILFTGSFADNSTSTDGSPSGLPNKFRLKYKGQYTIYENEVMVRIPMGSFNVSTNPSATYRPATGINNSCNDVGAGAETFNGPGSFRKTMFITGSAKPYITTVGLFNDKGQMLAVGKMAEPLENRDDIDMNIIVRWDF